MSWTVHLEGGLRRVNHAAVLVGDRIFSFGGYCTGENYRRRRPMDVHVLNTLNYRWQALPLPVDDGQEFNPNIPFQRYGHTAVAYGDKIYVWGGRNDEITCNILYIFDTITLEWRRPGVSGTVPSPRDGHSACVINDCMYVFGGFEEYMGQYSQDVFVLDLRTLKWRYIQTSGEPPSYRDFHSATPYNSRMYIFGGRSDVNGPFHAQEEFYCSAIMYLDTKTSIWHKPTTVGDIPIGRRSHSAFMYKDHIYVFGGYNNVCCSHFNDLHRFSPITHRWEVIKPSGLPPCKRRRQASLVAGDRVFIFGGTSPCVDDETLHNGDQFDDSPDTKLMDHDDLHVLDFCPTLKTLSLLSVINYKLDQSCLPNSLRWEINSMTMNNNISRHNNSG